VGSAASLQAIASKRSGQDIHGAGSVQPGSVGFPRPCATCSPKGAPIRHPFLGRTLVRSGNIDKVASATVGLEAITEA
jgi:hypothetical protein